MSEKNINKQIGVNGEHIACEYLKKLGWKILEKNFRYSKYAEIDIIAKESNTIVFIEVKTRTTSNFGHPFEAINTKKINNIYKATLSYLQSTQERYEDYRIDIISILGNPNPKIEHIKNISLN